MVLQERDFWSWEQEVEQEVVIPGYVTVTESHTEAEDHAETGESYSTPAHSSSNSSTQVQTERSEASTKSGPPKFRSLDELMLLKVEEPGSYREAREGKEWRDAMNVEMETIEKNKTWVLTDLPPGQKPIGLKWVYKLKKDSEGNVVKHKARLVAKGYVQRKGVDYNEVFALVARLETIRLLLALSAKEGWKVHHLDIKLAFLNGELLEEVYVTQPEGYEKKGQEGKVYRLLKALYGWKP